MNREDYLKHLTKVDPEKHCAYCNAIMHRKRINGRLEDYKAFTRRKYCNRECMKRAFVKQGNSNQQYSPAHHSSRKIIYLIQGRQMICENCGSNKNIDVHHKDMNYKNNSIENLMLLCRSCHLKIHRNK